MEVLKIKSNGLLIYTHGNNMHKRIRDSKVIKNNIIKSNILEK